MNNISQIQSLYTELLPSIEKELLISKEKLKIGFYIYIITLGFFGFIASKAFPLIIETNFIGIAIFLFLQIFIFSLDIFSRLKIIKKNLFYFREIKELYSFTINGYISKISEILDLSERMYELLLYSKESNRLLKFVSASNNPLRSETFYHKLIKYLFLILTDLRSDLSIRLTEQQQSLESAKSEVENNIKGTTELNQVSELQKARLDKQIEQFEELQRVLVKV